MTDSTLINTGASLFERISNPILAILLFLLFGVIYMLFKSNNDKTKRIEAIQLGKETEIKELNKILIEVRASDIEMLTELKNIISHYIEVEKINTDNVKTSSELLRRNNEILIQLVAKVEYSIKKIS